MTPTAAQTPLWGAEPALVFGVDPGSQRCGWGLLRREGRTLRHLRSGCIEVKGPKHLRLSRIHDDLGKLLLKAKPQVVAVEDVFVGKNQRTALVVGEARGNVLSVVGRVQRVLGGPAIRLESIEAVEAKKALTGHGRAEKALVARAVAATLGYRDELQEDEADALAVAITAARRWRR